MNTSYYEPIEDVLLERFERFCEENDLDMDDPESEVLFENDLDERSEPDPDRFRD